VRLGALYADFRRLYGERLTGRSEMPSRWALLRIAPSGRCSFRLMTPVGVLSFASDFSSLTSDRSHGSPERRLYFGLALRAPVRPIGEPGRFHDGVLGIAIPSIRLIYKR
jgi:hypothetical protein